MQKQNNTTKLHETIAHEIKAAKKRFFKHHREGQSLENASQAFVYEMGKRLSGVVAGMELAEDRRAQETERVCPRQAPFLPQRPRAAFPSHKQTPGKHSQATGLRGGA